MSQAPREIHELAEAFPPLDGEAFASLVDDIKRNGLLSPITLTEEGKILDGRNRYKACLEAGIEPEFEVYRADSREELVAFVVSRNFHRRHLNESQRGMVAARMTREGVPIRVATSQLNVSKETVRKAAEVLEHAGDNVISMVARGQASVHKAHRVVKGEISEAALVQKVEARTKGRPRGNSRVNAVRRSLEWLAPLAVCSSEVLANWPEDDAELEQQLVAASDLLNAIRRRRNETAVA